MGTRFVAAASHALQQIAERLLGADLVELEQHTDERVGGGDHESVGL